MRLRAARLAGQTELAMETARLLAKHRAFSAPAAQSIVRGLAIELLNGVHEPDKLHKVWLTLDASERAMPDVAVHAASRLMTLQTPAVGQGPAIAGACCFDFARPGAQAQGLAVAGSTGRAAQ
jgi:HemY protein